VFGISFKWSPKSSEPTHLRILSSIRTAVRRRRLHLSLT
jgi:hypothetical protein